jgi:hypothetical protein
LGPTRAVVSSECSWNSLQNFHICILYTVFLPVATINNSPVLCLQKKGCCICHFYTMCHSEALGWDGCLLSSYTDRSKYTRTIQLHWAESLSKRQMVFRSS